MKTLSVHIQESFSSTKEDNQTVVENLNDHQEEVVFNEDATIENEEQSE